MAEALTEAAVREALKAVKDPEVAKDLIQMNMIKRVAVDGGTVTVDVELTTPACPLRAEVEQSVRDAVARLPGVKKVELNLSARVVGRVVQTNNRRLPGVKNIIAVASGKGGVGKSTVAVNLALALQQWGTRVGLLDADIYGPSVPQMLGRPETPAGMQSGQKIIPAVHYGMRVMSVGFFVEREGAVVWRGPMVHKLLQQFMEDVDWGELDYLLVDLPPGTGDAQLSLSQLIPLTGAVMVTTPQEVAVIDVVRGISMFQKVEVPILGVIENMSYYVCPECGHHDEIFSRGGGRRLAEEARAPFLGEVPIATRVREGGDFGMPIVISEPDGEHARIFRDIASKVAGRISTIHMSGPRRVAGLVAIT
ncbi:MAG TPA: iron-sulfur cluster carrier protein ApbC [Polyangia bacterium]|nr:iron-sulfur cluster carrier protein ApbC [Polyangia bacterium]